MASGKDAFDLLGLPATFSMSAGEVQRAYLAKVGGVHPDRAGGGEDEAAALNAAKLILEDPELRANLLLGRLGGPARDTDRALPEGFLAEMMGVRERLEGASQAEAEGLQTWAQGRREEHMGRVGTMFKGMEGRTADREVLTRIRRELNAWRYIERMLEQIDGRD